MAKMTLDRAISGSTCVGESHTRTRELLRVWLRPGLAGTSVPTADAGPYYVQFWFL